METNYSLIAILKADPDFAGAFSKKKEAVKKDKQMLLQTAQTYTQKYEKEIEEGTKQRQILITEGEAEGLTEDEVLEQHGRFIPSIYTPILNWLFFTFREESYEQTTKSRL